MTKATEKHEKEEKDLRHGHEEKDCQLVPVWKSKPSWNRTEARDLTKILKIVIIACKQNKYVLKNKRFRNIRKN